MILGAGVGGVESGGVGIGSGGISLGSGGIGLGSGAGVGVGLIRIGKVFPKNL